MSIPQYDFSFDMEKESDRGTSWNRFPGDAARETLRRMGRSPDSLFGQYITDMFRGEGSAEKMRRIGGYFNSAMPDRNSNDGMMGPQRMMETVSRFATANPNDPRYLSYGKLGDIFQQALSGSTTTRFGEILNAGGRSAINVFEDLALFIQDFAGSVISEDRADLMIYELDRLREQFFMQNPGSGPNGPSFVQFLVNTAADTLDRWFGDRDWTALNQTAGNIVNNTGAGNQGSANQGPGNKGGGQQASGGGREGLDPGPHGITSVLDPRMAHADQSGQWGINQGLSQVASLISPQAASSGLPDQMGQQSAYMPSPEPWWAGSVVGSGQQDRSGFLDYVFPDHVRGNLDAAFSRLNPTDRRFLRFW